MLLYVKLCKHTHFAVAIEHLEPATKSFLLANTAVCLSVYQNKYVSCK